MRRVAIRINDAAVTNDVFVIFQPSFPFSSHPSSHPSLHVVVFLFARPSFAAFPGSRFTRRGSKAGGRRGKKSDKGEGGAAERARAGKINCGRGGTSI